MTDPDPLESRLSRALSVTDERAQRIATRAAAAARAPSRALATAVIAAAGLALAAIALWRSPGAPAAVPVAHVARDAPERGAADYDDPGNLGTLLRCADFGALVRVLRLGDDAVDLAIERAVFGTPPAADLTAARADGPTAFACCRSLEWTEGERCLVFFARGAAGGRLEVLFGGSGKLELPLSGLLEEEDVARAIATGDLDPERLARWIDQRGPQVLLAVGWHFQALPGLALPLRAPAVQAALQGFLERLDPAQSDPVAAMIALRELAPERLDALAPEVLGRCERLYPRLLAEVNGEFHAVEYLEPFARRGDAWALPHIVLQVEALERMQAERPNVDFGAERWLDLLRLLAAFDPEGAAARAWNSYGRGSGRGSSSAADVLALLLEIDPGRAAAEAVRRCSAQWDAGERVDFHLLLRAAGDESLALARRIFGDPRYVAARRATWHDRLAREVGPEHEARLRALAPEIAARLAAAGAADSGVGFDEFLDGLRLHRAAGGSTAPARAGLERWLAAERERGAAIELVREAEGLLGVRALTVAAPTAAELAAAQRTLLAELVR